MTEPDQSAQPDSLYGRRAAYYDAIYHFKAYDAESARLRALLASEGIGDGSRLAEAACGTGAHLVHLQQWFDACGFDISAEMLAIARRKLPGMRLFRADMCDFEIGRPVDALLCLFSSIGYVFPLERLRAAAACFARAVRPGGVLVIEPWVAPEDFIDGRPWMNTFESDDLKLCRMIISRREGDLSILDFHWLAAARGSRAIERFSEQHVLWLCPRQTLMDALDQAGFACRIEPDGLMKDRGLLIGRRRDT